MTSPAVDTGIVAFIEAQFKRRDELARQILTRPLRGVDAYALAEQSIALIAKDRAILALHRTVHLAGLPWCNACDSAPYPCQTVRLLAAIYADHPDYDPGWKPQN